MPSSGPPLRFSFVLTRYGPSILGGGEKHARDVAERLAGRGHQVRVLTTCATSYVTWKNALAPGEESIGGVVVKRFRVARGRIRPLDEIAKAAASKLVDTDWLGRFWSLVQGPTSPELVAACAREARDTDLFVFFSWLNDPQRRALALPEVGSKSAMVPLVHDEPPVYTGLARATLQAPRMLLVNTEEEWARIAAITHPDTPAGAIVAVGRDPPPPRDPGFSPPTPDPYLLVLGRAGKAKPVIQLWKHFVRIAAESGRTFEIEPGRTIRYDALKLLLVGEVSPAYADIPNVVQLGFVDDDVRWQLLHRAIALVNPSVHESLSLVLLEAWSCARPVVVNARCDVTVGQCRRSSGGFAADFSRPELAAADVMDALASEFQRSAMGRAGKEFVERGYDWNRVLDAYEAAAAALREKRSIEQALGPWRPPERYERAPFSAADFRSSAKTRKS